MRKGARRVADVQPEILRQLNLGQLETANLMECLALDFGMLLQSALPQLPASAIDSMREASSLTWPHKTRLAAKIIYDHYDTKVIDYLLNHPSDNVRGWTAGVVALIPDMLLKDRLEIIKPLANDTNSGTRETAWLLMREHIANDISLSINIFQNWIYDEKPNIRRYAIESTRPRGVWCSHINMLKDKPELGLPILEPLKCDTALYVQNSVGNWLNDAAKTKPEWVYNVTTKWLDDNPQKSTLYICKRARRSFVG